MSTQPTSSGGFQSAVDRAGVSSRGVESVTWPRAPSDPFAGTTLSDLRQQENPTVSTPATPPSKGKQAWRNVARLGLNSFLHEPADKEKIPQRKELFERLTQPWILRGRQDVASLLYYGGLSATGYPWRDVATKIFERSGFHTEVRSLAGHDGAWEHVRDVGHRQWIEDIVYRARQLQNPIFLGYSTSALAAIVALAENPGLFKALVLVAPPVHLRSGKQRLALSVAEYLSSHLSKHVAWLNQGCVSMGGPSNTALSTHLSRKSPGFNVLPTPTVFSLRRLQRECHRALKKVDAPVLVLQGAHDRTVSERVPHLIMRGIKSTDKECKIFPRSTHSILLGHERHEALHHLSDWLQRICTTLADGKVMVPDFQTRISKEAVAHHVMGTVWERLRQEQLRENQSDME